jgi:hypothetical protein
MENFDGVFKFTNNSDEAFTALWNNKEYVFPSMTRCPMVIPNEQVIRKKFALNWAQREFAKSKEAKALDKEGKKHFSPATYDELTVLAPWIQMCLDPLPLAEATVKEGKKEKLDFVDGGSAVLGGQVSTASLGAADGPFKEFVPTEFGSMSA